MLKNLSLDSGALADKPGAFDSSSAPISDDTVNSEQHDSVQNSEPVQDDSSLQSSSSGLTEEGSGDRPATTPLSPLIKTPSFSADSADLSRKLPYRPSQQVEFLNLQVEMETLLHQIHLHQRQRQQGEQPAQRQLVTSSFR